MFTFVHKKKGPGDKSNQISDPLYIRRVMVLNRFPCAPLGIVNTKCFVLATFFPTDIEYVLITILNI